MKKTRVIRIEGPLAYVPLTRGYEAVIDAADMPLVAGWNWHAVIKPRTVYAARADRSGPRQRMLRMHRLLLGVHDGVHVDHIDGDGLNNRGSNLRAATRSQNMHNQRLSLANTSGLKGIAWDKSRDKWRARIMLDSRQYHLGYFADIADAAAAYAQASAKLHGVFGNTG